MNSSILVIARKFNDIFYALSTEECKCATYKVLVIVAANSQFDVYPLKDEFDKVYFIDSSIKNFEGIVSQLIQVMKIKTHSCKTAIMSNPILIINQLLIKQFKVKDIHFIEDGLMNYYDFKPSKSISKKLLQFILGINQKKFLEKINSTYLLSPENGQFYFGEKKKLDTDKTLLDNIKFPNLNGKRIFVGQNMYLPCYGVCNVEEYNNFVNHIIDKYDIDYYLPHSNFSKDEKIKCPILNLDKYHVTLEYCAAKFNFTLYSYNSSVLYTTKLINSNIKSISIDIPFSNRQEYPDILKKYCDDIMPYN